MHQKSVKTYQISVFASNVKARRDLSMVLKTKAWSKEDGSQQAGFTAELTAMKSGSFLKVPGAQMTELRIGCFTHAIHQMIKPFLRFINRRHLSMDQNFLLNDQDQEALLHLDCLFLQEFKVGSFFHEFLQKKMVAFLVDFLRVLSNPLVNFQNSHWGKNLLLLY